MKELNKQIVLETDRLRLRHLCLQDAAFMFQLLNSEDWLKYIGDRNVKSVAEAEKYLIEKVQVGNTMKGWGMLLVENKTNNVSMGICGLVNREGLDAPDIGFAFLPQHYGKGYAIESASAVLNYAKEKLYLSRIQAITVKENSKSICLLKKLGMGFLKTIRLPNDEEELYLFEIIF